MTAPLRTVWQVVHRDVLAELLAAAAWHHDEYGFDTIDYEQEDQSGGGHKDAEADIRTRWRTSSGFAINVRPARSPC